VAPEHISKKVLKAMGKCGGYEKFRSNFFAMNKTMGLNQYLIPYYISGHPGSSLKEAIELALYLKESGFVPEQVQDFYPTPGTLSTVMYRTGLNPSSGEDVYVPKGREKRLQRALLHFNRKENTSLVREALKRAGSEDLNRVLSEKQNLGKKKP
jgi:radical SAM superfamily enzyme YgiQ (UPF0313 family)